jgi:hypothetical protein
MNVNNTINISAESFLRLGMYLYEEQQLIDEQMKEETEIVTNTITDLKIIMEEIQCTIDKTYNPIVLKKLKSELKSIYDSIQQLESKYS